MNTVSTSARRHDLDWLRVLAFGLLILYHVGMFYVADWGWHIKSDRPSGWLHNLMYLTNPWRMSLLFFVSGAAMYFACRKIDRSTLLSIRNRRLLLPLVIAILVVVPPQVWVELVTTTGISLSYAEFYPTYLNPFTTQFDEMHASPLGLWTWNHLWFLTYLWVYTLLFLVVKPGLDSLIRKIQDQPLSAAMMLLLPVGFLTICRLTLADRFPPSHALVDDWYNHARYLGFLFGGYLVASCSSFWKLAASYRWHWLGGAVIAYGFILLIANDWLRLYLPFLDEQELLVVSRVLVSFDHWLWMLALLGLGHHFLNRPSPVLSYMNEAILPWYILHQTLTVLLAFWLAPLALWQPLEVMLLIGGTVAGCAVGYELARRSTVGRLVFGLKQQNVSSGQPVNVAEAVAR